MKSISETLANVAATIACLVIIAVAWPQLKDRWQATPTRPGGRVNAIERVRDLRVEIPKLAVRGNEHAKVALVEFSDFQCPYCGRYARETAADIQKEFVAPGKVLYAFRNFPLSGLHPLALKAGQAAICAGNQHQFWPMHDRLFLNQQALGLEDLRHHAEELNLNRTAFDACLAENADLLSADIAEGRKAGVTATPTFLIGTIQTDGTVLVATRVHGSQPLSIFRSAVEEVLRTAVKASS